MTSKKRGHKKAMNAKGGIITAIVLVAFMSSAPLALAAELTIEPNDITPGPNVFVTINGTGFEPDGSVTVRTIVTCYKPVSDGKCQCTMNDFEIPANTSFKLSVRKVEDNVTMYIKWLKWWEVNPDTTSFFTFIYTGDPSFTSNVSSGKIPPFLAGTYSIDVVGDAVGNEENCTMTTSAELEVDTDANGNFTLDINTQGIPICNFTITATDGVNSSSDYLNLFILGDASKDGQRNAYDCVAIARYWGGVPGYDNNTIAPGAAAGLAPDCTLVTLEDARCLAEHLIGMHGIPCAGCIP